MILDQFKDIVKHTSSLGFIDLVKIVGTTTDAKIETIDADKTVVIFGELKTPLAGIESVTGLSQMGTLKGYLDFPLFSGDKAKVEVVHETRDSEIVPVELKFESGSGHNSVYRFMSEMMANEQIKVPPFKGATWDITIVPEKKSISDLSYFQGVLGGFEKRFTVSVNKNILNFNVGTGPTNRTVVPFATGVAGTLKHQWSWPLAQVLSILKLSETDASVTMKFSDMGALMIELDSGLGKYSYILPAGKA